MNTHDIELPPLPAGVGFLRISEGRISIWVDNYAAEQQMLSGSVSVITTAQAEEYARAAIEADRRRRGEQRAIGRIKLDGNRHPRVELSTGYDENGDQWKEGAPIYAATQPAEPDVLPGEAIFGFAAWLTSLKTPVTFSERHGAAVGADLAAAYNTSQGFDQVREDFHKRLKPYPNPTSR